MDLLTGYGSDATDDEDDHMLIPTSADDLPGSKHTGTPKVMPTVAQRQPPPQHHHQSPPESTHVPAGGAGPVSGLLAQLPRPTSNVATSASISSGLAGLPPPSEGDARGVGARRVVTMQLPFRKELLAAALDSDDEDEPAAKRVKATGVKSRLMDFLPPPKHDTGAVRVLGAPPREPMAAANAVGSAAVAAATVAGPGNRNAAAGGIGGGRNDRLPAGFFSDGAAEPYGNEAYRVRDDNDGGDAHVAGAPGGFANAASHYPHSAYGSEHDQSAYYAHDYGPDAAAAGRTTAGAVAGRLAAPSGPEDLLAEALRAEQERASKRGGGVKLVEVNAKDLTKMDAAAREAANSARDALGPEYALALRRSAAPFEGNKTARRKHQIGTLLFNARMQELDQMEKRTAGQKSKAETAAKYGW